MNSLSHLRSWTFPLTLFFFSFILRFALISKGPYHLDCLALAINSQTTLATHQLHHQFGTGYPLTVLAGTFFVALTQVFSLNDPVFAVNFMSVVFSSLTVLVFYFFLNNITNPRAAFYGTLLLSLHPIFLSLSVYGNSHTVNTFFLIVSLFFLTRPQQRFRYGLFTIFLGLMGAARLQDMILMLVPIGLFWVFWNQHAAVSLRRRILSLFVCLTGAFLVAGLFHLPLLLNGQGTSYSSQFQIFWNIGVATNFRGFFSSYMITSMVIICFAVTAVGFFISGFGLIKMFKEKTALAVFALSWFLVPLLFYGNLHSSVPRFFLISTFPLCLAFGYGVDGLLNIIKGRGRLIIAAACSIALLYPNMTKIFLILYFRHNYALYPAWAEAIKDHTEPEALIISCDEGLFISYYANRQGLYRPADTDRVDEKEFTAFKQALTENLAKGVPVYITSSGLFSYNPNKEFSSYIEANYRLSLRVRKKVEDWHGGELILDLPPQNLYKIEK